MRPTCYSLVETEAGRAAGEETTGYAAVLCSGKMGSGQATVLGLACMSGFVLLSLAPCCPVIQVNWRWHNCHTRGIFRGSYELTASQLGLELEIFLGSHIWSDYGLHPLPNKELIRVGSNTVTRSLSDKLPEVLSQ